MSMSKRYLDQLAEAEKINCGCTTDFDDKITVLCPKHQAEEDRHDEEFHRLADRRAFLDAIGDVTPIW